MSVDEIRNLIKANPEILLMAQEEIPNEVLIAKALPPIMTLKSEFVTERGVVATLGLLEGEAFLSALESFATSLLPSEHPLAAYQAGIARQLAWLKKDGIDVGSSPARALLDILASVGVIQPNHASAIKALAEDLQTVPVMLVRQAIWNDNGSRAI